jgi:hypothetical protein
MAKILLREKVRNLDSDRINIEYMDSFYMDDSLISNLDIIKQAVTYDWDMVIIVDGIERGGKSLFTQQLAYYVDPTINLDRIVFSPKEFEQACINAGKYQAIIWDEAITGANIRETMNGINISIMKMLGQIGQKNLFIFLVLPTYYDLDKYVALWRSRILFNVYVKGYNDRGYFKAYKSRKNYMYCIYRRFYYYPPKMADFKGRFFKCYVVDEIAYREKKLKSLQDSEEKIKEKHVKQEKNELVNLEVKRK